MLASVVWPALGVPGGITCSFHALGALGPTKHFSRVLIKRKPADPCLPTFLSVPSTPRLDGWAVGDSVNQGQGWEVMPQVLPDLNKHLIKISLVFNIAFSIPKS